MTARIFFLAAWLIAGCASVQGVSNGTHFSDKSTGPRERLRVVVQNQARWEFVWAELNRGVKPPAPLPNIDFTRQMVVVVALGQRANDCYDVNILEVKDSPARIDVLIRQAFPVQMDLCGLGLSYPWDAVVTAKSAKEVRFSDADAL